MKNAAVHLISLQILRLKRRKDGCFCIRALGAGIFCSHLRGKFRYLILDFLNLFDILIQLFRSASENWSFT